MAGQTQTGNISIHAQNIMPVIKRWLYSDKDIFIREMVSNSSDAITKYHMLGLGAGEDARIEVTVDKEKGEIRFEDTGIGMTWEEVERFINQVAFSSAEEFLKNYTGDDKGGIIGHFGLGFYSAFMVSDKVTIDTLSCQENAAPVRWVSEDGMAFEMSEGSRAVHGTCITLHIMDNEQEFLEGHRVREVLERYCGYLALPVYLTDLKAIADKAERDSKKKEDKKKKKHEKKKDKDKPEDAALPDEPDTEPDDDSFEDEGRADAPVNNTHPLWLKPPKDCTEEEYKEAYRKLFHTFEDPLFWVHLNVDYPFNLKGILYFPRIRKDFGGQEGEIKLFNRQVFVADNIKEVIPEFLMLLKGVIDCPDLPLNVSRSFLQNDGYVKKLSAHITKKVADKLNSLFAAERVTYQNYWDDINPFVKYGCIRDSKFFDSVKDSLIFKTTSGEYYTLNEYKARNEGKTGKKIYYTTEPNRQAASIAMYDKRGIDVTVLDTMIDMNFMSFMEYGGGKGECSFTRVDADVEGLTQESEEGKDLNGDALQKLFRDALANQELTVKLEALSDSELPVMLLEDEQMRRYKEMSVAYGQTFDMPAKFTLVLNRTNPTVRALAAMEPGDLPVFLCKQLFDIARLSSRPLEAGDLKAFLARSNQLVAKLADNK
jgi:molecular chaperone HtpG